MYGSSIEDKDYPVPRGNLRSKRGMRDLTSDPNLEDVSLHHLIRREGKPKAKEIAVFQRYFEKCNTMPDMYSVNSKQLKKYRKLVYDASVEELSHYEVVLATCAVGGNNKLTSGTQGTVYQVIIDECAMCPEPASLVPVVANNAKQLVLIGDHKQLRPIIQCGAAADLGLDQSLFERLHDKFYNLHTKFLDTQYRMHPQICAFPSQEFYENQLKTGPSFRRKVWYHMNCWPKYPPEFQNPIPHVLVDIRGEEETLTVNTEEGNERSKSNSMEAEKVIEILIYLRKCRVELSSVKVLTQYNAQRHLLETKLKAAIQNNGENAFNHYDRVNMQNVSVSTVVSSQGGEWDYVILSTVRSLPGYMIEPNPTHGWCIQNLGFITDRNQVNVALTRARKGLFVIGNAQLLRCDEVWKHLLERYERMGCLIQDASTFPPPLPPRPKKGRRVQNNARDEWQNVEISRPN
ncbi:hypothetical protein V1264_023346 [Littorina saxatilis]|uniref:Uncharacterized protein n=2 Tax=Littorina saxatilis TaxID=31220 RepID=A0AAN9G9Y7_9CAEN